MTNEELTTIYNEANGLDPKRHNPITTERIFAAMRAAMEVERKACIEACLRRAKTIRKTIHTANQRTSEHLMIRREARMDEANECATAIMERSNVELRGAPPIGGASLSNAGFGVAGPEKGEER